MKKRISVIPLLSLLLILSLTLGLFPVSASGENLKSQAYLDELLKGNSYSGVLYATKDGEVLAYYENGYANEAQGKEITLDTMFPIGSISKQFCATAVLLLQEEGKLSVEDKITDYFPEYTKAEGITIKNLLTHRSGIINHLIGLYGYEYTLSADATAEENKEAILQWFYAQDLLFKPDSKYEYSNGNFWLLSLIVEKVSGESYQDFIKENILIPLEMTSSGFYEELYTHPDFAEHHLTPEDMAEGIPIDCELKGLAQGAGDLVSTAKDMDKWLTSLREGTILSEESFKEMTTNYSSTECYGYGIGVLDNGCLTHNGAATSYVCTASTYPEEGINIFAITSDWKKDEEALFTVAYTFEYGLFLTYGDINCDNNINIKDATLIQKCTAKIFKLSETEMVCADVNTDGKVYVKDATAIQKHTAKFDTGLAVGDYIYR